MAVRENKDIVLSARYANAIRSHARLIEHICEEQKIKGVSESLENILFLAERPGKPLSSEDIDRLQKAVQDIGERYRNSTWNKQNLTLKYEITRCLNAIRDLIPEQSKTKTEAGGRKTG